MFELQLLKIIEQKFYQTHSFAVSDNNTWIGRNVYRRIIENS